MTKKIFSLLSFCFILNVLFPAAVSADQMNTELRVEFIQDSLRLKEVEVPHFGKQMLEGEELLVQAEEDLVLHIQDNRPEKIAGWSVYYSLGTYNHIEETANLDAQTIIGKGSLTKNGQLLPQTDYKSETFAITKGDAQPQLLFTCLSNSESDSDYYVYKVEKEKLQLTIPAESTSGVFNATQIVTLRDLPTTE